MKKVFSGKTAINNVNVLNNLSKTSGALTVAVMLFASASAASAEERTLSLYMVHTKEELTVTYKKDGRYIPSAMKKLDWFLRDWRRDAATEMDPKTIDLMWELHADLGSQKPVHIISGYRSPKTNALLRRIGRKVARRSQHIRGKAIDMYFPDVPTSRVRNSALVREIGGVGYYPRSGKSGFVHIDSGNVRHWPRVSQKRLAKIKRDNRKTVGARFKRPGYQKQKSGGTKLLASLFGRNKNDTPAPLVPVAQTPGGNPVAPQQGPLSLTPDSLNAGTVSASAAIPKPRRKPYEVYLQAANLARDLQVTPAAAPIERVVNVNYNLESTTREQDELSLLATAVSIEEPRAIQPDDGRSDLGQWQQTAAVEKESLEVTRWSNDNTIIEAQPLQPFEPAQASISAAPGGWSNSWIKSIGDLFRRVSNQDVDDIQNGKSDALISRHTLTEITADESAALDRIVTELVSDSRTSQASAITGKGDLQIVNRTSKSNLIQ